MFGIRGGVKGFDVTPTSARARIFRSDFHVGLRVVRVWGMGVRVSRVCIGSPAAASVRTTSPQKGSTSSFSNALVGTTSRRIPAGTSTQ